MAKASTRFSLAQMKRQAPTWSPIVVIEEEEEEDDGSEEVCCGNDEAVKKKADKKDWQESIPDGAIDEDSYLEALVLLERCQSILEDFGAMKGLNKTYRKSVQLLEEEVADFLDDQMRPMKTSEV